MPSRERERPVLVAQYIWRQAIKKKRKKKQFPQSGQSREGGCEELGGFR